MLGPGCDARNLPGKSIFSECTRYTAAGPCHAPSCDPYAVTGLLSAMICALLVLWFCGSRSDGPENRQARARLVSIHACKVAPAGARASHLGFVRERPDDRPRAMARGPVKSLECTRKRASLARYLSSAVAYSKCWTVRIPRTSAGHMPHCPCVAPFNCELCRPLCTGRGAMSLVPSMQARADHASACRRTPLHSCMPGSARAKQQCGDALPRPNSSHAPPAAGASRIAETQIQMTARPCSVMFVAPVDV